MKKVHEEGFRDEIGSTVLESVGLVGKALWRLGAEQVHNMLILVASSSRNKSLRVRSRHSSVASDHGKNAWSTRSKSRL